jgi:hypothetical protein
MNGSHLPMLSIQVQSRMKSNDGLTRLHHHCLAFDLRSKLMPQLLPVLTSPSPSIAWTSAFGSVVAQILSIELPYVQPINNFMDLGEFKSHFA